jgi:hypothetical protein
LTFLRPRPRRQCPQFIAGRAVIGRKEEGAVDVRKLRGVGAERKTKFINAGVDVLDQDWPLFRAVALPELTTADAIIGAKVKDAVDIKPG